MLRRSLVFSCFFCLLISAAPAHTITPYQRPSAATGAMLDQARSPHPRVSPDGRWLLLVESPPMPTIAELAKPMLRLGGTRISPRTNSLFSPSPAVKLTLLDL